MKKQRLQLSLLFFILFSHLSFAEVSQSIDPETRLIEWKLLDENLELKLIQRLPDQTRSFFEARGFSKTITNNIANSCVFQSITRNTSKNKTQTIHISLNNWLIKINNKTQPIKLKEMWEKEWQQQHVSTASRLAFRWATFPSKQSFEPSGDYNWGMISFGPKPGKVFDLYIEWKSNNKIKSTWIKNISCPKNQ